MSKLVIVESPTKVAKIQKFLPDGFVVDSSVGHIRDLPAKKSEVPASIKGKEWADYGIDYTDGFKPHYITIRGKGKVITSLKQKLKAADELWLATDEDREGEAIGWHLIEALQPKVPVRRMVFNEITKEAVLAALAAPRELDLNLVQAQETRRILDRLYGYALSPLLWKKIGGNLSAGRVQSVAVRLVVERERERRAFVTGAYWDLTAHLEHPAPDGARPFEARLARVGGKRIASGKDFDKDTGKITEGVDVLLLEEDQAMDLRRRCAEGTWTVTAVTHTDKRSRPAPPFITSTLQQEANNRLNLSARQSMQIAQMLYQNGYITYMRTDSTALSEEAITGARAAIEAGFGREYLPAEPREYIGKKAKGAQEAHEAIRPAGEAFQQPDEVPLTGKDRALYRLIWQRTLACQMDDERYTASSATLAVEEAEFTATGRKVLFPGYRVVYGTTGNPADELPAISEGGQPACNLVEAESHETKPPARFTEATLVRALEQEAIGRPSTYASILDTIQRRGYVITKGKALVPSFTAFAVTGLLEKQFPHLVDVGFTAKMEETLDNIAAGEAEWVPFLTEFFLGEKGLQADVEAHMKTIDAAEARIVDVGTTQTIRIGRFGPYVEAELDGETVRASLPEDLTPDEVTDEVLQSIIDAKAAGPQSLGDDPVTGLPVLVLDGRYGPYYQLGHADDQEEKPKRASLPKGTRPENGTLEEGLFLLSLPLTLGDHPDGGDIIAGLGRFGPYVAHRPADGSKPDYRSLAKGQELADVGFDAALALLAQPKKGRGQRGPTVLKDLGAHPKGGTVQVLDGRYGPYVKHNKTNATVPKEQNPNDLTLEAALELLAAKNSR